MRGRAKVRDSDGALLLVRVKTQYWTLMALISIGLCGVLSACGGLVYAISEDIEISRGLWIYSGVSVALWVAFLGIGERWRRQ